MPLSNDFIFSAQKLQDFVDCPRRFDLRYVQNLQWPAQETKPYLAYEEHLALGKKFHQLVHQYIIGIPTENLLEQIDHPILKEWWQDFSNYYPSIKKYQPKAEVKIGAHLAGYRIIAIYDVLYMVGQDSITIIDWKTTSGNQRTPSKYLSNRLQSKVYPLLYMLAHPQINQAMQSGKAQLKMIYWFPAFPTEPEEIPYSWDKFQNDKEEIVNIFKEINEYTKTIFPLTSDKIKCRFCVYRSFCSRGSEPGDFQEHSDFEDTKNEIELDFDRLEEIAF